jgi:hypothetical protein
VVCLSQHQGLVDDQEESKASATVDTQPANSRSTDIGSDEESQEGGAKTLYIAFRGTDSISDLLDDITALPVPTFGFARGSVHLGFQRNSSRFDVMHLLPYLDSNRADKVIMTGHSLGGAVAVLAVQRLLGMQSLHGTELLRSGRLRCITFGAPLVGDRAFGADLKSLHQHAGTSLKAQPIIHVVNKVSGVCHDCLQMWLPSDLECCVICWAG